MVTSINPGINGIDCFVQRQKVSDCVVHIAGTSIAGAAHPRWLVRVDADSSAIGRHHVLGRLSLRKRCETAV